MPTHLAALAGLACLASVRPSVAQDTSWVARSAIYEVNVRAFSPTGDFPGLRGALGRIQAAGADVVWLMPIHPVGVLNRKGPLGSPYSVRDYYAIDPAFGTADDFRALVQAVHDRGMRIIIDWVPNHTAWDHRWVTEHPDFYVRDAGGGLVVPRDPQGNPTDWTDVADLDYGNPDLRRAMIDAMRHWLQTFELDGFRVDVAGFVPDDFWREALPALRAAVPRRILLLAEWGDLNMHRLGFDLTYGWDGYGRLKAVWRGAPADSFVLGELADLRAMPPGGMRLRFTTNHDETAWDSPPVTLFGGSEGARAAFVAMALLPGRPLIYSGQDVESPQKLGLFVGDSIMWSQPDSAGSRAWYRRVVDLARTGPEFLRGDLRLVETSAPRDVIAYGRGMATVLVNVRPREVRVRVPGIPVRGAVDLLSGHAQHENTVTLPAHGAVVLERVRPRGGSPGSGYRRTRSSTRASRAPSVATGT